MSRIERSQESTVEEYVCSFISILLISIKLIYRIRIVISYYCIVFVRYSRTPVKRRKESVRGSS